MIYMLREYTKIFNDYRLHVGYDVSLSLFANTTIYKAYLLYISELRIYTVVENSLYCNLSTFQKIVHGDNTVSSSEVLYNTVREFYEIYTLIFSKHIVRVSSISSCLIYDIYKRLYKNYITLDGEELNKQCKILADYYNENLIYAERLGERNKKYVFCTLWEHMMDSYIFGLGNCLMTFLICNLFALKINICPCLANIQDFRRLKSLLIADERYNFNPCFGHITVFNFHDIISEILNALTESEAQCIVYDNLYTKISSDYSEVLTINTNNSERKDYFKLNTLSYNIEGSNTD